MPKEKLLSLNSHLRDALEAIEDLVNQLEQTPQSRLNVDELVVDNTERVQTIRTIRDVAEDALEE